MNFPLPMTASEEMVLNIAGQLLLEKDVESTLVACSRRCCNSTSKQALLADENGLGSALLPNLGCFGDESRLCCNVIAVGQHVVARGLVRVENVGAAQRAYFKDTVSLCAL